MESRPPINVEQAYKTPDLIAVLLSGGVDSTTVLHMANEIADQKEVPLHTISFNYGQRHRKEIEAAAAISEDLDCTHHVLDLLGVIPRTMLTDVGQAVPNVSYADIKGVSPTYVPFRNGLMLAAATAHVLGVLDREFDSEAFGREGVAHLYCGIHSDDAAGFAYPDCTPEWFGSMANAIFTGTYGRVRLVAPALFLTKAQIVSEGEELGVDWAATWSCYKGEELHCGVCPTCIARQEAFATAGVDDPTAYASIPDSGTEGWNGDEDDAEGYDPNS